MAAAGEGRSPADAALAVLERAEINLRTGIAVNEPVDVRAEARASLAGGDSFLLAPIAAPEDGRIAVKALRGKEARNSERGSALAARCGERSLLPAEPRRPVSSCGLETAAVSRVSSRGCTVPSSTLSTIKYLKRPVFSSRLLNPSLPPWTSRATSLPA